MTPTTLTNASLIPAAIATRFRNLKPLIGNTPLLAVHFRLRGQPRVLYAKAENLNLTGSIKDRMAFHILRRAYLEARIHPGDTIAEATSGNTGISFAAIGRALGHQVVIFMPDWMSEERVKLIRAFGAQIVPVSREQGGFLGSINKTEELAEQRDNVFLPCQFSNEANVEAHRQMTGPEIWQQLRQHGLTPAAFVAGVGTGGTIMGAGRYLRSQCPTLKLHPVEPAESPTLTTGHKVGHHRIQGISDEFIPAIVELDQLDDVLAVPDGDAILMAQKLAAQLGLGVGISSGANFIAALLAQERLGADAVVATVFADSNKKYLSTDLLRAEPVRDGYLAPDIELSYYEAFNRVCLTCLEDNESAFQSAALYSRLPAC
ncbi:MAG: cysteine synthase family protein [Acidobacteria bacterium]|nr:cysteine synthase family protein [Acidobacteriota bacterium]MBI3427184.1 cysteine synthase family protein [Acidobacteriota bacterium]